MGVTIVRQNQISSLVLDEFESVIGFIGTGDDDTTPTVSDTTLGNETIREAIFGTSSRTANSIYFEMFQDTADNNGNDIKETGCFSLITAGIMYNHALTNVISKTTDLNAFVGTRFTYSIVI